MKIMITNQSSVSVDQERIKRVIKNVLLAEASEKADVSLAFIDETEMREINKKYRGKDEVTDVLSFPHDGIGLEGTGIRILGEILICPSRVKEQAEVSFDKEMTWVVIHGVLHLLGYDHESSEKEALEMKKKEDFHLQSNL